MRNWLLRRRLPLAVVFVLFLAFAGWVVSPSRKVPLHQVLNPIEWVRHWRGQDRYDARQALLEQGDPSVPEIALTFDDGPDPRFGPAIADLLKRENVPAAFFVVGIRAKQYPNVILLLQKDGFEIGNHTYDHQSLPALKPHEIANELRLCDRNIFRITGRHMTLMRPPGVQYNDKVLNVARSQGYVTVSWTVGAHDYELNTPPHFIIQRVLDRTENGSIILLHQTNPATLAALPTIIQTLQARGFRFVTISQMLTRLHARLPNASRAAFSVPGDLSR